MGFPSRTSKNLAPLAACLVLLLALLACGVFQPSDNQSAPPLIFPSREPLFTYTPAAENAGSGAAVFTPEPQIVTATPVTPSPTPAGISLNKLGQWNVRNIQDALWYPDSDRFVLVGPDKLSAYTTAGLQERWSALPARKVDLFSGVSISSNGNFIVNFSETGQGEKFIQILDADSGEITDEKSPVAAECSAPLVKSLYLNDGMKNLFAAHQKAGASVKILRWTVAPMRCEPFAQGAPLYGSPGEYRNISLSPDQGFLMLSTVGSFDGELTGRVVVWNAKSGKQVCETNGVAANFRPSDDRLAVADMQNDMLVYWHVASCQQVAQVPWVHYDGRQAFEFTPDGKYLVTFRQGIQFWDPDTGGLLLEKTPDSPVAGGLIRISPDGKYLISISYVSANNALVELWAIAKQN